MAFDIKKQNLNEIADAGYEFEVKLPDGTSTDCYITVRGNLSPLVKKHGRDLATKISMKEIQDKKRNKGEQPPDFDDMEKQLTDAAAVRVISWRGMEDDGVIVEATPENVKRILGEHTWIREQVLEQGNDNSNFI